MHLKVFFGGFVTLVAAAEIPSRFLPDLPPVTRVPRLLEERKAGATPEPPAGTLSPDPWQCVTENINQYFDILKPTGKVLEGINSYGAEVAKPCRATATGLDLFSCTVSDPKSWCGFTTAAPADVMASYSTYVSEAVSFWTAKRATISVLSTSCPVAWAEPDPAQHEWLKIALAHAECYLQAHPDTETKLTSTTPPARAPTSTNEAISRRGQALESLALVGMGLGLLVNAA